MADYTLDCNTDALAVAGTSTGFSHGRGLNLNSGALSLAGQSIKFPEEYLYPNSGVLTVTGQNVGLLKGSKLKATTQGITLAGQSAIVNKGFNIWTTSDGFSIAGSDIFFKPHLFVIKPFMSLSSSRPEVTAENNAPYIKATSTIPTIVPSSEI